MTPAELKALREAWAEGGGKFSADEGYPEGRALALVVNAVPGLLAEIGRLRAALEEIARSAPIGGYEYAVTVARAALGDVGS